MTTLESKACLRPPPGFALPDAADSDSEPRTLGQAVQAAVRSAVGQPLRPVARPDAGLAFQPRALLALLSYCYLREIYGSADVEDVLRSDVNFRGLCANEFPGASLIRRFRSYNREALCLCLTALLRFVANQKITEGVVTKVSEKSLAEEANRRVIVAMFIDSIELDGH